MQIGAASAVCRADAVQPHARGRHELPPLGLGAVSALVAPLTRSQLRQPETKPTFLHAARELEGNCARCALRGDTKTLFHTLDLLEQLMPIATFMDFGTELEELRPRGRANGRTDRSQHIKFVCAQ